MNRHRLALLLSAALAPACSSQSPPPPATTLPAQLGGVVTGAVTYRQRIALPAQAEVAVALLDVSRADAPADTLASQRFAAAGRQGPGS